MRTALFLVFCLACGDAAESGDPSTDPNGAPSPETEPDTDDTDAPGTDAPTDPSPTGSPTETPTEPPTDTAAPTWPGPAPASLVGNTYLLDLNDGVVVSPAGGGVFTESLFPHPLLVAVTSASTTSIALRMAAGDAAGDQAACVPSAEFDPSDFTGNPSFASEAAMLRYDTSGVAVDLESPTLSGAFTETGDAIVDATFEGLLDTRPWEPLLGMSEGGFCALSASLGSSCVACPDGTGDYCIELRVEDLDAWLAPGTSVVEVTDADVAADPSCL